MRTTGPAILSMMRSLALLIAVAACAPRGAAQPESAPRGPVPVVRVPLSTGCPTNGRLHGSVRDANSGNPLSLVTIVATGADGTRRVAISDDRGSYCIETEDVDVQLDVYFIDIAVRHHVHLGEERPAATDIRVDAYPVSVDNGSIPRWRQDDECVIPVKPKIIDAQTLELLR